MTREEAISRIQRALNVPNRLQGLVLIDEESANVAIEALQEEPTKAVPPSLADVYKWERDIALSQLEEYGIGFAEKKRDDLVEVVRCKDCKYLYKDGECPLRTWFTHTESDFCSYGERREP